MRKTLFALALLLALLPAIASATVVSFSDVPVTNKNFPAIEFLKRNRFVQGYSDGTFGPKRQTKRVEFLKLVLSALHDRIIFLDTESPLPLFRDVKFRKTAWYSPYVVTARIDHILSGNKKGEIQLLKEISRAEAVAMVVKTAGYNVAEFYREGISFSDVPKDAWYRPFLKVAVAQNLIASDGKKFLASSPMSRAEAAELVYRGLVQKQKIKKIALLNRKLVQLESDVKETAPSPYVIGEVPQDFVTDNPSAKPDLVISRVEKTGPEDGIFQGSLKITVENIGTAPLEGMNVCLFSRPDWYNYKSGFNSSVCGAAFGDGQNLPTFYPGKQFVFYLWGECNQTSKETKETLFAIDADETVSELDETNNGLLYTCPGNSAEIL